MDTFDLMKEYNYDRLDPLAGLYDRGTELIGEGEVGIWFMGNWAWPQINDFDKLMVNMVSCRYLSATILQT